VITHHPRAVSKRILNAKAHIVYRSADGSLAWLTGFMSLRYAEPPSTFKKAKETTRM
jgi:hypothetical protein